MTPHWGAEFLFALPCLCKDLRLESLSIVSHLNPLSSGRRVTHPGTTAGGVLRPPMHHPLLDELSKLFSGSSQMSRTKPYIVTMIVISLVFFFTRKSLFLKEYHSSLRMISHTLILGTLKRLASVMGCDFRKTHGMLNPSPLSSCTPLQCHCFLD